MPTISNFNMSGGSVQMQVNGRIFRIVDNRLYVDGVEWVPIGEGGRESTPQGEYLEEPQTIRTRLSTLMGMGPPTPPRQTHMPRPQNPSSRARRAPADPVFTGSGTVTGSVEGDIVVTGSNVTVEVKGDVEGAITGPLLSS